MLHVVRPVSSRTALGTRVVVVRVYRPASTARRRSPTTQTRPGHGSTTPRSTPPRVLSWGAPRHTAPPKPALTLQLFSPECSVKTSYEDKFYAIMILPVFFLMVFLLVYLIISLYGRCLNRKLPPDTRSVEEKLVAEKNVRHTLDGALRGGHAG